MLALRLPKDIEERLDALARRTGRTKSFYARKAIVQFIEDMEDVFDAEQALADSDGRYVPLEEIEARIAGEKAALAMDEPVPGKAA